MINYDKINESMRLKYIIYNDKNSNKNQTKRLIIKTSKKKTINIVKVIDKEVITEKIEIIGKIETKIRQKITSKIDISDKIKKVIKQT